jgi:hypothetical protein
MEVICFQRYKPGRRRTTFATTGIVVLEGRVVGTKKCDTLGLKEEKIAIIRSQNDSKNYPGDSVRYI